MIEIKTHCKHTKMEDVTKLVPHPQNPNRHSLEQIALLSKVIEHQGWRSPVVVSKRSGFIIAGHGRLEAAKHLGLDKVPIEEQDFKTEADEYAHLIADNRISELAQWDNLKLRDIMHDLSGKELDLELTGFSAHELESLTAPAFDPAGAPAFSSDEVTSGEVSSEHQRLQDEYGKKVIALESTVQAVTCPKCGEDFDFSGKS
jgi:ParB-like chromosome segregation protein Spo0J